MKKEDITRYSYDEVYECLSLLGHSFNAAFELAKKAKNIDDEEEAEVAISAFVSGLEERILLGVGESDLFAHVIADERVVKALNDLAEKLNNA